LQNKYGRLLENTAFFYVNDNKTYISACDVTPPVKNGNWMCQDMAEGKHCELHCDKGFMTMGIKNISCTHQNGWSTMKNWLEVPLCLGNKFKKLTN
jgi:hypothetical protein